MDAVPGSAARADPVDLPSPRNVPSGCRFRTRCAMVFDACPNVDLSLVTPNGHGHPAARLRHTIEHELAGR